MNEERAAIARAGMLLDRVREQIDKRHYLNAATTANRLSIELMSAFSAVLKEADE